MATEEGDNEVNALLQAAWNHDLPAVKELVETISTNVQEPTTLHTPLHKAILSLRELKGQAPDMVTEEKCNQVEEAVRLLFTNGAIWNDLDSNGMTPGCYAYELGEDFKPLYDIFVDAGVRAELLLQKLDGYMMLGDGEDQSEQEEDEIVNENERGMGEIDEKQLELPHKPPAEGEADEEPQQLPYANHTTPAQKNGQLSTVPSPIPEEAPVTSCDFLSSRLTYHTDKVLDSSLNGVMMAWEDNIMRLSAYSLLRTEQPTPPSPLRILNIGFGLGLFDNHIQAHLTHKPTEHTIIEAHPDVLKRIHEMEFDKKPGVRILQGKWQDVLPDLVANDEIFDGIYFDTFAEDYSAFREFFQEYIISILNPQGGRFGFFNGLGADRRICYDVYQKVLELDLFEVGLDVTWESVPVPQDQHEADWDGVRRKYWVLDEYRLPTCSFADGM